MDGLRVEDLRGYFVRRWPVIKEQLLNGSYEPQPVLWEIPKSGGGMRQLGITTTMDRLLQLLIGNTITKAKSSRKMLQWQ